MTGPGYNDYFFEGRRTSVAPLVPTAPRRITAEESMLSPGQNRLLSLAFAAAVLPLLGLYALLISISIPSAHGGMEPTMAMICYIALTIIFSALTTVVVNFSLQFNRQARGQYQTP